MNLPFLALLAAATLSLPLVDDSISIGPSDWRYVEVVLKQKTATVDCEFRLLSQGSGLRALLVERAELDRLRAGHAPRELAATAVQTAGRLHLRLPARGDYALVFQNPDRRLRLEAHVRVSLDFSGREAPQARVLPPGRRAAVVAISFALFFAVVTWSARRMMGALREPGRNGGLPPPSP
jgi:hypothetical protein